MAAPLAAGAVIAGWQLWRPLSAGAHSQVWLARRGDAVAALKLQPLPAGPGRAAAAEAFRRAATLAATLAHPSIAAVWEAGIAGEGGALAWLAMEPVPGRDLQRYTREPRLLPEPVVLRVLQRVAAGLAHAHAQGVLHRDLKPANVLVDWATDTVRIVDFGLARGLGPGHTVTGVVPGTPAYMAPEQLAGTEPDARADLYALGAMAFELLAGRRPHEADTMGELLRRVAQEPAPELQRLRPGVTPALAALVARLLARERTRRPPHAAAVADELATLREAGPAPGRAGSHRP